MDPAEALAGLPPAHSLALRLHGLGADLDLIAQALRIEPEGVTSLLTVAQAKLDEVLHDDS